MQVLQLFHYPTILQGQLTSDGINILYSNDHPFIHTQILGFFIKIGIRLKHVSWGYGIYTFLQMSAYIIGIALLLATLNKFAVDQFNTESSTFYLCINTSIPTIFNFSRRGCFLFVNVPVFYDRSYLDFWNKREDFL